MHQILCEDAPQPCGDDHVTKSRNRKLIRVTSSNESLKDKCVSVTIQLLLHSFAICGLILRYGVRGVACQKQRLGPKLEGAGLGEHPKNLGPLD